MRETQYDIVLNMLRKGSVTTRDIFAEWINCPPKVIEGLRKKGYKILTEPIEGKNYCKYTLIPTTEQGKLF